MYRVFRKTERSKECHMTTHQEGLVELKQTGKLFEQLVNTVQPLQEYGTLLAHIISVLLVATAVSKLMAVVQPLSLYKQLETLWTTRGSLLNVYYMARLHQNIGFYPFYSTHFPSLSIPGAYITHKTT